MDAWGRAEVKLLESHYWGVTGFVVKDLGSAIRRDAQKLVRQVKRNVRESVKDVERVARDLPPELRTRLVRSAVGAERRSAVSIANGWKARFTAQVQDGVTPRVSAEVADGIARRARAASVKSRAQTIYRTEMRKAESLAQREAFRAASERGQLQVDQMKRWVTADPCPECIDLGGLEVPVLEEFPDGDPPIHPNCRCSVELADG